MKGLEQVQHKFRVLFMTDLGQVYERFRISSCQLQDKFVIGSEQFCDRFRVLFWTVLG